MTLSYFDTLSIRKIDLSPDGKFFTILKNDKTTSGRVLEIWEVSTKQRVYTSSMSVHGSLFWPAGDAVMIYGDGVELWSLSLRKSTYRLSNKPLSNTPRAKAIAIHPGGTTVAYVLDNQLHIGDLKTSTFSHQLTLRGSVHRMDFHPTKPIISLLYKDNIELRDASTGQLLFVLKGPKELHQGYFHTNGKEFRASSQTQPGIWVWDISTGRLLGKEQPTLPAPFKMSRDGDILLNWVQVWNARTGVIYFSGGRKPSPFDVALSYIHLDPTGTYLTYKEKQVGSFSLPMWALMDISGRVFYKEYPVEKQESLALPPYLPFISGLGAHGQVAVLEHNDFQGVYSLTQKKFLGYTPLLQVDNSSAIATSKDGKTIAARYKFDHFRVWYCQ